MADPAQARQLAVWLSVIVASSAGSPSDLAVL